MTELLKNDPALTEWVAKNRNAAMRDRATIQQAIDFHAKYRLPVHNNAEKAWDNLIAIYDTVQQTDLTARVLDAGGEKYSVYLPGLRTLGYTDLTAINLTFKQTDTIHGISYQPGDITHTEFRDEQFDFVACLSVLEHGVDWRRFLTEAARVLKPGGGLFISVDYWDRPVDTQGKMAYGVPIHIFDAREIAQLIKFASYLSLTCDEYDLACRDRTVRWMELDYTFFNVSLHKSAS